MDEDIDVEVEVAAEAPKTKQKNDIRRFRLKRTDDVHEMSGVGYVAEGVQFSDGMCVIKWSSTTSSIGIYHSEPDLIHIHGHGGKTTIEWIDEALVEKEID